MDKLFKALLIVKTINNFPLAFKDRLGLVKGEVVYKIRKKGLRFIARAGTEDMAEIVVVTSGYEYDMTGLNLPNSPIIVDLGGHIGSFSVYIGNIFKNKAKIFTFEPDNENYKFLKKNININKVKFIYPKNLAISDYVGKGFLKKENMNTDAYYLQKNNKKIKNCTVSTLRLEFKKNKIKRVDLLKIDVEGGEYSIFNHKASLNILKKNVHYIFMEYHDIDATHNYSLIKKIIEKNFAVINKRKNILTLENKNFIKI